MHSKNRRSSHAVRLAQAVDLGRLSFALTWGAFGGPPRGVSRRAARVLLLFAAANRCGSMGYRGVRASLGAVAAAVARVSGGEAASEATVRRGLHELVDAGLLVSAVYGGGAPRLVACGDGESHWIRDQQVAYTVTAAGLACWSWSRESAAAERKSEKVVNCASESPLDLRVAICESNKRIEGFPISSFLGDFEKTPAHVAREPDHIPPCEPSCEERPRAVASSPSRCGSTDEVEARGRPSRVGTADAVTDAGNEEPQERGQVVGHVGERAIRFTGSPVKPWGGVVPMQSRREIEAALVTEFSGQGRAGRLLLGAACLALADPASWARSPLPWWEWVKRWPRLTRSEQRHLVRSEIRPSLGAELERRTLEKSSIADVKSMSNYGNSGETDTSGNHDKSADAVTMAEAAAKNQEFRESMERILGHPLKP